MRRKVRDADSGHRNFQSAINKEGPRRGDVVENRGERVIASPQGMFSIMVQAIGDLKQ